MPARKCPHKNTLHAILYCNRKPGFRQSKLAFTWVIMRHMAGGGVAAAPRAAQERGEPILMALAGVATRKSTDVLALPDAVPAGP